MLHDHNNHDMNSGDFPCGTKFETVIKKEYQEKSCCNLSTEQSDKMAHSTGVKTNVFEHGAFRSTVLNKPNARN